MKFACFERTVEALYLYVVPKPRADCSKAEQLIVTFVAGYIAGVFCAIVSHPADTIVSKLNQEKGAGISKIAKQLGWAGELDHIEADKKCPTICRQVFFIIIKSFDKSNDVCTIMMNYALTEVLYWCLFPVLSA